jgi:hypothetical protein
MKSGYTFQGSGCDWEEIYIAKSIISGYAVQGSGND